jgi:hypothetical protein
MDLQLMSVSVTDGDVEEEATLYAPGLCQQLLGAASLCVAIFAFSMALSFSLTNEFF